MKPEMITNDIITLLNEKKIKNLFKKQKTLKTIPCMERTIKKNYRSKL